MGRTGRIFLCILFILLTNHASKSYGGYIQGSAHDFSSMGWSQGQICLPCHTPHNANPGLPLWNRTVEGGAFLPYTASATMDSVPINISTVCLQCHDGTVAIDSYGGTTGSMFISNPSRVLGQDGTDDHPINFTYDNALAFQDGYLNYPTDGFMGNLPVAWMGCESCHNVHGSPYPRLLRTDNTGSGLCLTCHIK